MASGSKKKGRKSRCGKKPSLASYREYLRKVDESEGFDCDDYPKFRVGLVRPIPRGDIFQSYVPGLAELAINHYNLENDTNYELVEVLKANMRYTIQIFITFNAKIKGKDDADTKTFQARLSSFLEDKVIFVRLKSPPNLPPNIGTITNQEEHEVATRISLIHLSDKEIC